MARLKGEAWKTAAINAVVNALLDPDDSRSRCRVSHEDSPEIFITEPPDRSYDGAETDAGIQPEHLMTLDQELRWIPAATHSQAYKESLEDFSPAQVFSQTQDLDRTADWEWTALRQSRIRFSVTATKIAELPRPKSAAEIAVDRADLRIALRDLSRGELRAVILRFAGCPLTSGERGQLMRAFRKSRDLRKRIGSAAHIVNEGVICADRDYKKPSWR